jgi:hypothetical protein
MRGSRTISFNGEYCAFVTMNQMSGAWFAGKHLVGLFRLRQTASPG